MECGQKLFDINEFKEFITHNKIESRTVENFWHNFESYQREETNEFVKVFGESFCRENLEVEIQTIALKLGNWPNCNNNHIVVTVKFGYKRKNIGKYEVLFTFSGEVDDDFFVIY